MALTLEILLIVIAVIGALGGLLLCAFGFSGTWVPVLCAALATFGPAKAPGWRAVAVLALSAALLEGVEALAGWYGVKRSGGSAMAGWAAIGGGLVGGLVIGMVPGVGIFLAIPGMLAGSFVCVYLVEKQRLGQQNDAVRIATAAIVARAVVIITKVVAMLVMSAYLIWTLVVALLTS